MRHTHHFLYGYLGNKLDPSRFEITDISKTVVCPLAKAVRTELRKRGIRGEGAVFQREAAESTTDTSETKGNTRYPVPGVSLCPVRLD